MSITTLSLYESLLRGDRPLAWWGLDSADPTDDDSGHGYDLTAVGAPANAASLLTRGDGGASGSRDFDGAADAYFTLGTLYDPPEGPPPFHAASSGTGTDANAKIVSPGGVAVGDLLLVVLAHATQTATISSAPAGWTQVGTTLNATNHAAAIYRKTAVQADTVPQEYVWVWSSAGGTVTGMLVYRGLDPGVSGLIYDSGQQATASATSHSTTTETHPAQARQLVIWTNDSTATITPNPAGIFERLSAANGNVKIRAVDYLQEAAGSGARSATTSAATVLGAFLLTFGAPNKVRYDRLDTLAGTISIHALIRPDTITGTDTIVRKHQAYGLQLNAGTVELLYRDGGGTDRTVAGPSVSAGVTTHLIVADDGTTIHFYKDGVETTAARVGVAGYTTNANRVTIGAYHDGAAYSNFFDGRLDELAIFNAALSDQMAAAYYTAASAGTFGSFLQPDTTRHPRVKLEIAWASAPTDDVLVYEDVTPDLRAAEGATTSRGRNFELDRIETGTLDFTLDNRSRQYDPSYTGGPYYPNVKPTRAVRMRAQAQTDGVVRPIFFGYTEGHPLTRLAGGPQVESTAVFTAADVFVALALDKIRDTFVRDQERTGARLTAVLEGVQGIPYSGDEGQSEVVGDDLKGVNRLEHAQAVAETDGGIIFADAAGQGIFQDRHYRTKNERTVRATYGDGGGAELPYVHLQPLTDTARLFTAASVTPASGAIKTAQDDAAADQHFVRTKELITLHASDNDAQAMANAYAGRYATPRTRIPAIVLKPANSGLAMWDTVLGHEFSHRIKTVERPVGAGGAITREHFIEGIGHALDGQEWRVTLSLSPAELEGEYMLIGTAEIGDETGMTAAVIGW